MGSFFCYKNGSKALQGMHHHDKLVYIVTTPNCEPYPKVNPVY